MAIYDVSMRGARGVPIPITGGRDLTLFEVDQAATRIREELDPDANIIVGATFHRGHDQGVGGSDRCRNQGTIVDSVGTATRLSRCSPGRISQNAAVWSASRT